MASNVLKISSPIFMGNPIVYQATAEAEPYDSSTQQYLCTFHRVKMVLTITNLLDNSQSSYELSNPVSAGGETVLFNVSPAFQAAADAFDPSPVTAETMFPLFSAAIRLRDVWVREGVVVDPAPASAGYTDVEPCLAVMGAFSDYERHLPSQSVTFSRKPSTGELVCVGDVVVYGGSKAVGNNPIVPHSFVSVITQQQLHTQVTLGNGQKVYVTDSQRGSRQFQLVNSRGVVESIRAWYRDEQTVAGSNEQHTISRFELFNVFARRVTRKFAARTELSLSSGFVSYEWAQWWAYEFCQSEHVWMLSDDGIWIPCSVTLNDSYSVIDRNGNNMCHVDFTCIPDLNGAMW